MQRYLITETTIEPIEGNKNKILINGVIYTSGELAKRFNMNRYLASTRMSTHIKGKIPFSDITNVRNVLTTVCVVGDKELTHWDLHESTGFCRAYIMAKMKRYNAGEINAEELQRKKGTGRDCAAVVMKVSQKQIAKEKRPKQTIDEIDADYNVLLRRHKMATCNQTLW